MALVFSIVDMKVTLASSAKINSMAHRECPPSFRTRLNSEATEITHYNDRRCRSVSAIQYRIHMV